MRVLVTGARGKVGRATVSALLHANHEVVGTDLAEPGYDKLAVGGDGAGYVQADLREPGDAFVVIRDCEAVVHCAAIPTHRNNTPHFVFANNLLATFNVVEAVASFGIERLVNISSPTVAGYTIGKPEILPNYLPTDEQEQIQPQEPYSVAKYFGEQLMDFLVQRSDVRCISLRPSWVQRPGDYAVNLGHGIRCPGPRISRWSYVDMNDLVDAIVLSVDSTLPGHEVFHIAAADNAIGRPLETLVSMLFPERITVRPLPRPDASAVSSEKARRLLGYVPKRSWRDYLRGDGEPQ
jgi:UDP-glucose 4-epimerase